jgi:hypothetical protein
MLNENDLVILAKQLMTLPTQQVMLNQACLEDVQSIQVKSSKQLDDFLALINSPEGFMQDPEARMNRILQLLTLQNTEAKGFKDRLVFWDRQEKLVGVVHEIVDNTRKMVAKVSKVLEESLAELKEAVALTNVVMEAVAKLDQILQPIDDQLTVHIAPGTKTLQ